MEILLLADSLMGPLTLISRFDSLSVRFIFRSGAGCVSSGD